MSADNKSETKADKRSKTKCEAMKRYGFNFKVFTNEEKKIVTVILEDYDYSCAELVDDMREAVCDAADKHELIGIATCHPGGKIMVEDKEEIITADEFDYGYGISLAIKRLLANALGMAKRKVESNHRQTLALFEGVKTKAYTSERTIKEKIYGASKSKV